MRIIQALLGHSSSKTTEIYTQVTTNNLRSIQKSARFVSKREIYPIGYIQLFYTIQKKQYAENHNS
nr:hypothetical protein [Aquimarina macrocephali]